LRARGGFEVGIAWRDGKLASAMLQGSSTSNCTVRYASRVATVQLKPGVAVELDGALRVAELGSGAPGVKF